ncbi:hypothetical protein F7725_010461 [Dissostichus mawsoni]|uniref:Ig-like domain-containing protein n=1 Tax=Dissostichus mawsoni TaxID=36200 RepID=A0A7J5XPA3_DISMA|nr:hypothetical protein F7725_010461 [Dissostichus mawsoni]
MFFLLNHADQRKSVYVKQSPKTKSVQPGDSVTLECSLLSKNKENADQCPGEHNVSWFRSGSGESQPSFYTHSEEQKERSCVFSLSKTIHNSSDTGTYYCAVATCGQILFGEGTTVETRQQLDLFVPVLGTLLACTLIQTAQDSHQISLTVVELGDDLGLACSTVENEAGLFYWYKLKFGYMVETVAAGTLEYIILQGEFKNSRLTVKKLNAQFVLNIRNVTKEDEGTYFCQAGTAYSMELILFGEGTTVETRQQLDLFVPVLGTLLACSLIVIAVLIIFRNQKSVCEHCKALIVTAEDPHLISLDVVVVGGNVTYQCPVWRRKANYLLCTSSLLDKWPSLSLTHTVHSNKREYSLSFHNQKCQKRGRSNIFLSHWIDVFTEFWL